MPPPSITDLPPPPPGKTGWPWTAAEPLVSEISGQRSASDLCSSYALPTPGLRSPVSGLQSSKDRPQSSVHSPQSSSLPRISIVTPSFNQGHFIEETIRSVLLQGYPNLEYIIIDGGSTDNTVEIIRKYEPWLTYWVSEKDRGQSHAINKGWSRATGDIVAYINSDDVYCPGAFHAVARVFAAHPDAGMVYGDCDLTDVDGTILRKLRLHQMSFADVLAWMTYIAQPSVFLRRTVIERVGMINLDLHLAMDYDLWLRMGLDSPMKHIAQTLSRARLHKNAKTSTASARSLEETIQVASSFFDRDLPPRIAILKHRTMAAMTIRQAGFHLHEGHTHLARSTAIKAIRMHPSFFIVRHASATVVRSLIGVKLLRSCQCLKQSWLTRRYRTK